MCRTMRETTISVSRTEVHNAWERLSETQMRVIEETIVAMTKEPNCSPYRAINAALDFFWITRNQRNIDMGDILRALKRFNEYRAADKKRYKDEFS